MSSPARRIHISAPTARSAAIAALLGATLLGSSLTANAAGPSNPSVSFDATGFDRQAIDREANNFCSAQGKTAAYIGQSGSRLSYDCVPYAGNTAAPAATYAPAPAPAYSSYGNGANNPSISYDSALYDRQAIIAAANDYCGAQGKAAAFSGRSGSIVHYDCVPYSDSARAPVAVQGTPVPSVTYQFTGDNRSSIEAEAARYCGAQGRTAHFRGQDGSRVTYDCVIDAGASYTTAPATGSSNAVPTITYSMAGNTQQNADAPAIRYCAMQGKSPFLVAQNGTSVTYECR